MTTPVADLQEPAGNLVGPAAGPGPFAPALDTDGPGAGARRLEDLPRELGVLLASVGVLGVVLPGVAGAPALLAGGLVLWPKTFGKVEGWFRGRFPVAHRESMRQMGRFLDDMERRYPSREQDRPR